MSVMIEDGGLVYTVVDDETTIYQAIVVGRVLDEVTGTACREPVTLTAARTAGGPPATVLAPRILTDGYFCVAAYAELVFVDPTVAHQIHLTFSAAGYRPAELMVAMPPLSSYPTELAAPVLLRPLPIRLQGRVTLPGGGPLHPALVELGMDLTAVPPPADRLVGLRSALGSGHPGPSPGPAASLHPLSFNGGPRHVVVLVPGGTQVVKLDDRTGLTAGDILYLGDEAIGDGQFRVIAALGPSIQASPGDVTLANPVLGDQAVGTPARGLTPTGAALGLSRAADAGDGVIFAATLQPVVADAISIVDPVGGRDESALVGATTDVDGYYRFDGVGRLPDLVVSAAGTGAAAGHVAAPMPWSIDFSQPVNVVDLRAT
jgi:hypothetical protein